MIDNKVLYKVKDDNLPGFWMLAVEVEQGDGWIGFHDMQRGHSIDGHLVEETPDGFVWQRQVKDDSGKPVDEGKLTFTVMTLEEFDRETRDQVAGPVPDFTTDQDLWEWYRRKVANRGSHY